MTNNPSTNEYRTWIEIDSLAFHHNIAQLSSVIGPRTSLGVVVKADAYGHNLELIGKLCQENHAVSWLFTAGIKEAVRLRMNGVTKSILVLAYADDNPLALLDYQITYGVSDTQTARQFSEIAVRLQQKITVHIKIDSGMSRFGFQPETLKAAYQELSTLPGLAITGIFTHLSDTNNSDYSFIKQQLAIFDTAVHDLENILKRKLFTHALASGALHLLKRYDCVRVGTNVYGYWKSPLQQQRLSALQRSISLQPILTWKTRIIALKNINPGDAVGYHRAFIAPKPMKIAILPVGYYDGYPRGLSHKGQVLIRDTYAPLIGIISMNSMLVDVTDIGSVQIDDEVVLCGDFPGLRGHDLAAMTDSIQNEFLTRISPCIPRVLSNKKDVYEKSH